MLVSSKRAGKVVLVYEIGLLDVVVARLSSLLGVANAHELSGVMRKEVARLDSRP